jgi:hypothetical protein
MEFVVLKDPNGQYISPGDTVKDKSHGHDRKLPAGTGGTGTIIAGILKAGERYEA